MKKAWVFIPILLLLCGCPIIGYQVIAQQSEYQPPVPAVVVPTKGPAGAESGGIAEVPTPGPDPTVTWINPVGWYVSSPFGWRPGIRPGTWEWHGGADLAGPQFSLHKPVVSLQDATIFDIRYDVSRYRGGGLCVEIQNVESYEEVPTVFGYCHLAPYQVRGHVYDAETGKGLANAVVYLTYYAEDGSRGGVVGERECGICDDDNNGEMDYDFTVRDGQYAIVTDDSGAYCYDYSTPDGGHTAVVELPPSWENLTPTEVGFEIRVNEGVVGYDTEIDFYAWQPVEPTPTPTPTPYVTTGPGGAPAQPNAAPATTTPAPAAQPAGGIIAYDYGPRYVPGWGPPITFHTPVFQNLTKLGFIGTTGRETGPHLHLFISRIGYRMNVYGYKRPKYPDGSWVPKHLLIVTGNHLKGQVDPMQFLPLANDDFGLAYMDQPMSLPPPGHELAGEGEWWSPGDYWSYGGGGRLRGYDIWRWFDWIHGAGFCGICPCSYCPKCSKCR